jgi:superfamily I DNA and RNA helicase
MKPPVIGTKVNAEAIDALIDALEPIADAEASFYVGYPVAATSDAAVTVPALLISPRFGLVCFDVVSAARAEDAQRLRAQQGRIVVPLKAKLLANVDLAGDDFELGFKVNVMTFALNCAADATLTAAKIVGEAQLATALAACIPFDNRYLSAINASVERVANIRPKSKRLIATEPKSKGSILKKIENEIANLDSWQKAAAIETPDGPQRIRGLAGSGKTIVLALKAAYLHGEHPDWKIGVTFHTRSLRQQFQSLTKRFYFDDYRETPDKERLQVLHSFGSNSEPGIYSEICAAYGIQPRDFGYAKRTYGFNKAFEGICSELLPLVEANPKPLFDVLLIDEAQDLPKEFLRLAYLCTRDHRIAWAYDDLQNLGDYQMTSLRETFGVNAHGEPLVQLENLPKRPRQDIILPKCYRNTPWALVTAHALGSGIYRGGSKLVQHPDDPALWADIGYEVADGSLTLGQPVVLRRSTDASPRFFYDLLDQDDAVKFLTYPDEREQFIAVAKMIHDDLNAGQLYAHDIAVVFPNAIDAERRGMAFRQFLGDLGIKSHIVGVTSSRDEFHQENQVAISGPYRAKGNEAPMIFVMDANYCAGGSELIKKRNILFTAITRSRGWVRVCGIGPAMDALVHEFQQLRDNDFQLRFKVPTPEELRQMRTLYRDISFTEKRKADEFARAFAKIEATGGDVQTVLQALPKETRERIIRSLRNLDDL